MPHPHRKTLLPLALASALLAGAPQANADDILLVGNKADASVSALDTRNGQELLRLPVGSGPHEVVVSGNGLLAVVGNYGAQGTANNSLSVIDWPSRTVVRTIDLGQDSRPHGIRFLPDSQRVVVTTEDSERLLIVDLAQGKVLDRIEVGGGKPHMVALSPGADRAYVTHVDGGSLSVVDLLHKKKIAEIPTGQGSEGVAVTPTGTQVWVSNRAGDDVAIVDTQRLEVTDRIRTGVFPIRIAMTPNGKYALVTCAKSAELAVIDVVAKKEIKRIGLAREGAEYRRTQLGEEALPIGAVVSPDGQRVYVAISGGDEVAVIDTANWSEKARWKAGPEPDALAIVIQPKEKS
ncbi:MULTISPECIES: cytochrome D1 domain-containing protein [unclassified Pseudomonas]|uniref:YVTN family beta-propeller repeat protein n=1 Tax=unclassified Pseudomonas TaxID=196821 RepID=UPI0020984085|nr:MULTISPECIES: cytochrome D1 domain-containing protein [unclassified Pseudomonas]MCO7519350.1 beta-propeller fold lactonase family protein [Pseudomonas sp. 1]MCO7540265.1 beta-propeller fold lactonase family protein [Pseudomonas sp. VA159-2]